MRAIYQNYRLLVPRGMKSTLSHARFQKATLIIDDDDDDNIIDIERRLI